MTGKVAIVCPFFAPNIGGVETHLTDLTNYLEKKGIPTTVLTYQPLTTNTRAPGFEKHGCVEIHRIPWFSGNIFRSLEKRPLLEFIYLTPALLAYSFFKIMLDGKVKVIHAHGINAGFMANTIAGMLGKKSVVSIQAVYEFEKNPLLAKKVRGVLEKSDSVIALSEKSRKELEGIGIPKEKIDVCYHWADQNRFRPMNRKSLKKKFGWKGFTVLFVGRAIEEKGADILIETAKKNPGICFAFVTAAGPLAGKMKKEAEKRKNMAFMGAVEYEKLHEYYAAADILAVPSKYEEGFGRIAVEALSCGTPVIASNRGGLREIVDSSVGVLAEPNTGEFERAIRLLRKDKKKYSELAKNARPFAVKKFSERNANKIIMHYEMV